MPTGFCLHDIKKQGKILKTSNILFIKIKQKAV